MADKKDEVVLSIRNMGEVAFKQSGFLTILTWI